MSMKLLNQATATGQASRSVKVARGTTEHTVEVELEHRAAAKITAATVVLQGSQTGKDGTTGVITNSGLALGSTAEKFANGLFYFRIADTNYSLAADAVGAVFSAAHVVSASKYGVILCFVDVAGDLSTQVVAATQAYDDAETAHAAADTYLSVTVPQFSPALAYIGRILIANNAGAWTANTDDMTDASDVTTATFIPATPSFFDIKTYELDADDITAGRALFTVAGTGIKYARIYLKLLTGTGYVTVRYMPVETLR